MNAVLSILISLGLILIYGLLRISKWEIAGIPFAEFFLLFIGFFLSLLGLNLFRALFFRRRRFKRKTHYFPSGRIRMQRIYDVESNKLLFEEYYNKKTGRPTKSIRYDTGD